MNLTDDNFCVYRIKDTSQKIKIKTQQDEHEVEKTYDLTGLKLVEFPVGEEAFNKSKTDYGEFGKNSDFYDSLSIDWEGTKATVTGTLKWVPKGESRREEDGNFYAFALGSEFNRKSITVDNGGTVKSAQDTDWVCTISEKTKTGGLTVKCGDILIAAFDFSGVILGEK